MCCIDRTATLRFTRSRARKLDIPAPRLISYDNSMSHGDWKITARPPAAKHEILNPKSQAVVESSRAAKILNVSRTDATIHHIRQARLIGTRVSVNQPETESIGRQLRVSSSR